MAYSDEHLTLCFCLKKKISNYFICPTKVNLNCGGEVLCISGSLMFLMIILLFRSFDLLGLKSILKAGERLQPFTVIVRSCC